MITEQEITIMDHVIQTVKIYSSGGNWQGYLNRLKTEDRKEVFAEVEKLLNDGYKEE